MKKRFVSLLNLSAISKLAVLILVFAAVSCGGNSVGALKGGHFKDAPRITINEVVSRYKHINKSSLKWEVDKDINKNEYSRISMNFDNKSMIVFGTLQEMILSGEYDSGSAIFVEDNFYHDIYYNQSKWEADVGNVHMPSFASEYFKPNLETGESFFTLIDGTLAVYFEQTPSNKKTYEVTKARMRFNFENNYSAEITVDNKVITRMFLENIDMIGASEELFDFLFKAY